MEIKIVEASNGYIIESPPLGDQSMSARTASEIGRSVKIICKSSDDVLKHLKVILDGD